VSATLILAAEVLEGTVDPAALVIDVVPSVSVPDLSVATDADLHVLRGDGTTETWTCTMSEQTATSLRLTHPWASTDTDTPFEQLIVYARVTLPSGVRRLRPVRVTVRPESSP
jgi:hypothetical protein